MFKKNLPPTIMDAEKRINHSLPLIIMGKDHISPSAWISNYTSRRYLCFTYVYSEMLNK